MKRIGMISTTAALFLVLGITAPAGAQDKPDKQDKDKQEQPDKHEKDSKPEKQQQEAKPGKQQEARPEKPEPAAKPDNRQEARPDQQPQKQEQGKPAARQDEPKQQPQHQQAQPQEQSRPQARQEERQQPQQQASRPSAEQGQRVQQGEQRGVWQQHRARSWESEHRTWQQRGGYNGYRIPDATFRISFGEVHTFRIYSLPVLIVGESPRFQYGGFWFSLVDPWPETWSDDWYETDDVYIDYYGDGYYMYNRRHPGVRIAITVFIG